MIKEVTFYHLTSTPLEKALPNLVFKIYETQERLLLVCKDSKQLQELNDILWTFSTKKFIPHGSYDEENAHMQPVLLSTSIDEKSNKPKIALLLKNIDIEKNLDFQKYIYMFSGNEKNKDTKEYFDLYDKYQKLGYNTKLWTLDPTGKWVNDSVIGIDT